MEVQFASKALSFSNCKNSKLPSLSVHSQADYTNRQEWKLAKLFKSTVAQNLEVHRKHVAILVRTQDQIVS